MEDFGRILRVHQARYPLMLPQDLGKLSYQSEFGPEHMIADEREAAGRILAEWKAVTGAAPPVNPEPVGNGLVRFYLIEGAFSEEAADMLAKLFTQSAREHRGTREGLEARLRALENLPVDGIREWLAGYRLRGCPPVHHSEAYRTAYAPHYRVLLETLAIDFCAWLSARRNWPHNL